MSSRLFPACCCNKTTMHRFLDSPPFISLSSSLHQSVAQPQLAILQSRTPEQRRSAPTLFRRLGSGIKIRVKVKVKVKMPRLTPRVPVTALHGNVPLTPPFKDEDSLDANAVAAQVLAKLDACLQRADWQSDEFTDLWVDGEDAWFKVGAHTERAREGRRGEASIQMRTLYQP